MKKLLVILLFTLSACSEQEVKPRLDDPDQYYFIRTPDGVIRIEKEVLFIPIDPIDPDTVKRNKIDQFR